VPVSASVRQVACALVDAHIYGLDLTEAALPSDDAIAPAVV